MKRGTIIGALMMSAVSAATSCSPVPSLPPTVPSTMQLIAEPPVTRSPDFSRTSLIPIEGSAPTSTIAFARGAVNVSGRVVGPDGPVVDATVRVERIVGDQTALTTITSGAGGRWKLTNIMGGVLRVQAFKVPNLAMAASAVTFAAGNTKLDLTLERYEGTSVQWALAPSQPVAGRQMNLVVQVAVRRVDADGFVRTVPLADIGVNVVALAALQPVTTGEAKITDELGRVSFRLMCTTEGDSSLRIDLATGEVSTIVPNRCQLPPTTPPPTPAPGETVPTTLPVTVPVTVADPAAPPEPGAVPVEVPVTQAPAPA